MEQTNQTPTAQMTELEQALTAENEKLIAQVEELTAEKEKLTKTQFAGFLTGLASIVFLNI